MATRAHVDRAVSGLRRLVPMSVLGVRRPGPYAVRLALLGWASPLPRHVARISALPPAEAVEVGKLWRGGPAAFAELWRLHEPFLRREATRLGIRPRCSHGSTPCFYAERIAAATPAATQRARRPAKKGRTR
jgi:hypothetical protein